MNDGKQRRWTKSRTVLRLCAGAGLMFVICGFVIPGVWGAVTAAAVPVPWSEERWGAWILFWFGVSMGTWGGAAVIFQWIERRARDR